MAYASLAECVRDLEASRQLVRLSVEIDPRLEAAAIQRRVFRAGGPALLFERLRGTPFPAVANLFGTKERARFLFRDALAGVRALVDAKVDVGRLLRAPSLALRVPGAALHALPRTVRSGPVLANETRIGALPAIVSWPDDGGPFITLPQVFTEDPDQRGLLGSNLGMYRVQLGGNAYAPDREVGLHYQLHRGIGVHHAAAIRRGEPLEVSIFIGGPPAMTLAAVMPLPEGLPEIAFAGALGGRAIRMIRPPEGQGTHVHADADFCIRGTIVQGVLKPEGPFGDHLGYYAKEHPFPVLAVRSVHHRDGAIWPFTTVGRPPQEDTLFGELIHELTAPLVPEVLPGVVGVNAVDAAGVHPLLLAVGRERYVPYADEQEPMELLTQASAILGQGQLSLAKYLLIAADGTDKPPLHDVGAFLSHVLERFDPRRDLHFHARTTIDTLDYSGVSLNHGSKLVVAAAGPKKRSLGRSVPSQVTWPQGTGRPAVALPGVLAIGAGPASRESSRGLRLFCEALERSLSRDAVQALADAFPLIVLVDDAEFAARSVDNLVWVTFTRSNPAVDVDGVMAFMEHKAWGCRGSLVIDARIKAHHAPELVEDEAVSRRVEALAVRGGPLAGLF
ncbi:MAG: UbiD family decarboxylase [Myxococcales bacterium]|nr:UbiD family decarboxylase [Myxococcales bacterium]